MRIALLSDIHSNYIALNAVLEDVKKQKVDEIFCLGDLIGYAPFPDKIFPILKNPIFNIKTVIGNYEESVILGKKDCGCDYIDPQSANEAKISFEWTLKNISKKNKSWLRTLPRQIRLKIGGKRVLMVHGSPEKINGIIDFNFSDEDLIKIMRKAKADILFCGHTHLPFHKIVGNKHIINPGSVGRPRIGSPQANYAIIDLNKQCELKFRFIDYNYKFFADEIENSNMPKNNFAEAIRNGYWRF